MKNKPSRRDVLRLGGMTLGSLAFTTFLPGLSGFDDGNIIRVATNSVSAYSKPDDKSDIMATWYRDELIHVYSEYLAEEPKYNPVWFRVWNGYLHRGRIQRVKTLYQKPLDSIPEGQRRLAEITVPYTQAYRFTKAFGWQPNLRLYYESVHWIEAVEEGPDGGPWYRVFDHIASFSYHIPAIHARPIPISDFDPISPDVAWDQKHIEVNLATQKLTAYEGSSIAFQTTISSGIPAGQTTKNSLSTKTPDGKFQIIEKLATEHMGNGGLFADVDDYELPGVPWTSYFTPVGHAFHGTFWHENFGTPMSHGCINMRSSEAKWLFRWATPTHNAYNYISDKGRGTSVEIHY
jgi:hypothetical protein